jgi:hypothetical protein
MLLGMFNCRALPTGATVADAVNLRGECITHATVPAAITTARPRMTMM